jgi:hypothetical protein
MGCSAATTAAVFGAFGGGGCQQEITGQCCEYQSNMNTSCQQAMAPYSDSCSSCGGSGTSGGEGGSGGSGGGGGSSSGGGGTVEVVPYNLSFLFSSSIATFAASSVLTQTDGTLTATSFSSRGLFRFNKTTYSEITSIQISEVDKDGVAATSVFDAMVVGETITLSKKADSSIYVIFTFVSQVDNGDNRTITVEYKSSKNDAVFTEADVVNFNISRVVPKTTGTVLEICPYCQGTGLEGSTGGLPGLVMAVYNGSAEWAGATNIDIYGVVQE